MNTVTLHTTRSDIVIKLFNDEAPIAAINFVGLANGTKEYRNPSTGETKAGEFYNGFNFHHVVDGFMIQGGCPLGTGTGDPGCRFTDELHPELSFNHLYLLAMASTGPGIGGSQFFITVIPTLHPNRRRTIFGEAKDPANQVVVDAVATAEIDHRDRPATPMMINSVTLS